MSANLDWGSFWRMFDSLEEDRKAFVAAQVGNGSFDEWMRSRSVPVLMEVLAESPKEVALSYVGLLPRKYALRVIATYPTSLHTAFEQAYNSRKVK